MNRAASIHTPPSMSHRPVVMADRGMVVAGHHKAAEAGAAMLRAGGNAMDAAVATAATLAIAVPFMNGLGGDSIALYAPAGGDVVAINGSGATARKASVAMFRDRGILELPQRGPLTVSVPGFVAAIGESAEKFATFPLPFLLEPAIALAEEGVALDAAATAFFNGPVYESLARDFPALVTLFVRPGTATFGQRVKQQAAARTLRKIAEGGWRAFYAGPMADDWLETASTSGVLIDREDLIAHRTAFSQSLSVRWHGRDVHAAPPNSQGIALLVMLGLAAVQPPLPPCDGTDPIVDPLAHLARKLTAFEIRDRYCADPRRVNLPSNLLSVESLSAMPVGSGRATESRSGGGDTSTFVVIDKDGGAVSWVQSLFEEFGSCVVCADHGIVLHNRAALELLNDDPVRSFKGGYRPFHTLCPALAIGPDQEITTLATPGDHGQPQTLALVLRRIFDQRLDVQAAVEWPRMRHDKGLEVMLEDRCPQSWDALLSQAGWKVRRVGPWSRVMGGVNVISRGSDGILMGGADPRRSSYAIPV